MQSEIYNHWQSRGGNNCGKSMDLWKKKYTKFIYIHTRLWGSYIQSDSSTSEARSMRRWTQPPRWSVHALRDSWLISSLLWGPCGDTEATGWRLRLEHMSYRFPENCIFLDSWRRDSQTAAASSGQPAIAMLAQSWKSSHDLKKIKWREDRLRDNRRVHTGILFPVLFLFSSVSTPYVAFTPKRVLSAGNFYPHF